jgi:hypothetical protein
VQRVQREHVVDGRIAARYSRLWKVKRPIAARPRALQRVVQNP